MWQDLVAVPGVDLQVGQVVIDAGKELSLSDFEAICRENPDLRLEQKATGELVIVAPHGGESSNVSSDIVYQLKGWVKRTDGAKVFDSNALYLLPDGSKLSPDVSLLSISKWRSLTKSQRQGFMPTVPDFVVEVRSPSDRLNKAQDKMLDWIANGVPTGWLLDIDEKKAWIYTVRNVTEHSLLQDLAGIGPINGFVLSVKQLYESLE